MKTTTAMPVTAMPVPKAMLGLSLVELMIATALGLIVAGAAVALFNTNRVTFAVSESMGRIQESTRVAFEMMSRDLRDGGGNPCDNGSSLSYPMTNGLSASSTWWANWSNWMVGYNGLTAFPDAAFGTTTYGARVAGTDAIEIKSGDVVTYTTAESTVPSAAVAVASVADLQVNDVLIICDYRSAAVFKATSFAGNTILHATGGTPGNATADIQTAPPADASYPVTGVPPEWAVNAAIARGRASRWFVGCNLRVACNQPGGRSLFQTTMRNNAGVLGADTVEIAHGVNAMTLQYLPNGGAAYVAANAVTDWTTVVAVKITLTVAGQEPVGAGGAPISKTIQHVISFRNRLQ